MMKHLMIAGILSCFSMGGFAQIYKDKTAPVEDRTNDLLHRMTLEEKLDYIGGYKGFYIRGIERLGVPEIKLTDGPVGTHKDGKSTAYPAGVLTASTWNRELVYELGKQLGRDSKARGVHILLGPGVNIVRSPLCGRNFEYFTEDPYLNSQVAIGYVKGLQDQKVVATLKHYAANNQEWDRNNVSSDIDERVLHEIYLPVYRAAIQEAGAGAVMDSYNPVNGVHATQNDYLNNQVLRKQWGFDGIVMSDWSATYDAVEAANGGLDLEMPRAKWMNKENLMPAIKAGKVKEATIDEKVKRILRIMFRFGFFEYDADLEVFIQNAEKEIERVKNSTGLSFSENIGRLDLIRYSALPWFAFSEMKHAVSFGRGDSVPRISTGKLIKENGVYLLPISISGHHALMDGRNVAELIEKLETTKK